MNKLHNISRRIIMPSIKLIALLSIVTSIIVASCDLSQKKPIEGAWNLVYAHSIANGEFEWKFPNDYTGSDIKIWTKSHTIFVGTFKNDTTSIANYGGGTYTLDGNRYEETIQYHSVTSWVGSKNKMLIDVKGDSLIQTWPCDDNWQIDKNNYRVEKYIRLD